MIVGIDISMLVYQGSGVATYTYELVKNLLIQDKKNEYRLFYSSLRRPKNFPYLKEFRNLGGKVYDYPFPPFLLKLCWNRWHIFPVEWLIGKVDIFHSSDFLRPPLLKGTKGITTVHDLTWKIFPQFHTDDIVQAHRRKMDRTIQHGDFIVLDSGQTKKDLYQQYPRLPNRTEVVPLGISDRFFSRHRPEEIKVALKKYHIDRPYLLYVGAIEPRKNLTNLLIAFKSVLKHHPKLFLVMVGRAGWKNSEVFAVIDRLKLHDRVIITGYVTDQDLPLIYQGARLFVYPSLYEGFGLPPLESLASGTKIVAYNCPSLSTSVTQKVDSDRIFIDILKALKKPIRIHRKIPKWPEVARRTLTIYRKLYLLS